MPSFLALEDLPRLELGYALALNKAELLAKVEAVLVLGPPRSTLNSFSRLPILGLTQNWPVV